MSNGRTTDRASVVAVALAQIFWNAPPLERLLRVAEYLRGEFADLKREAASEREGYDDA